MTNEIIIRRLSLIKQLYLLGVDQSMLPESISYTSVLSIHDSLDMFMNLVAEKESITKGQFLMQYFDSISYLTLKSSVDKINKRRNSLKHHGIIPGKIEIQDTCSVAKVFFEDNVKIAFNIDFNEISLLSLVNYTDVRNLLIAADSFFKTDELKNAANETAKAYFHLLLIHESSNRGEIKNPWYGLESQPLLKEDKFYTKAMETFFEGQEDLLKEPKTENGYVEISEGVAAISYRTNNALSYIFQVLRIFSLGLDFKKHSYYMSFMPTVISLNKESNKYTIGIRVNSSETLSKENVLFAMEFVTDFALRLQEFRY
jgi:hypothetical protein